MFDVEAITPLNLVPITDRFLNRKVLMEDEVAETAIVFEIDVRIEDTS